MSNVKEKIAYLHGLKDGLTLKDQDTAKLFNAVIEVFEAISESFEETDLRLELMDDCIDEIYEDLECVEGVCDCCDDEEDYKSVAEYIANYYDDEEDYDEEYDEEYDDLEDSDFITLACPHCDERICIDISLFKQGIEINCPSCSETVFVAE